MFWLHRKKEIKERGKVMKKVIIGVEELIRISKTVEPAKNRAIRRILSELEKKHGSLDPETRRVILDHVNALVRDFYRVFDSRVEQ